MGETGVYLLGGLMALNLWAFMQFGLDKWRSVKRGRRTAEARLLAFAFWGGFPGAKLGQHFFRHKTRKQPFAARLNRIGWMQAVLVASSLAYWASGRALVEDAAALSELVAKILSF